MAGEGNFTQKDTVECEIELSFKSDAASNHLIEKTKIKNEQVQVLDTISFLPCGPCTLSSGCLAVEIPSVV